MKLIMNFKKESKIYKKLPKKLFMIKSKNKKNMKKAEKKERNNQKEKKKKII